jgi:hypothetical protein
MVLFNPLQCLGMAYTETMCFVASVALFPLFFVTQRNQIPKLSAELSHAHEP